MNSLTLPVFILLFFESILLFGKFKIVTIVKTRRWQAQGVGFPLLPAYYEYFDGTKK
jgi:hypothetical protein